AGAYAYKISMVYADGETLPSAEQAITVAAGDEAKVEVTYSGAPLYANVFRGAKDVTGSGWKFIGRIALVSSGTALTIDLNQTVPGSGKAYLLMHDADAL